MQAAEGALRACGARTDCPSHLSSWALLGLYAAPKEISGFAWVEVVFGQPLVLPGELVPRKEAPLLAFQDMFASSSPLVMCQPSTYDKACAQPPEPRLQAAKLVYVKRGGCCPALASAYMGPYKVIWPGLKFFSH
jgi:hypothetical protein